MSEEKSRLEKQLEFLLVSDQEKKIGRQTWLSDGSRKENDAEHGWHMALMAYILQEYANEPVDVSKVMLMCLIHDLPEIFAGDTYAYDEEARKSQKEREEAGMEQLFSMLPKDQYEKLKALFEEFEARKTPEARFANALDTLQPTMLNAAAHGKSWTEHGVKLSQVLERNQRTEEGSKTLWDHSLNQWILPQLGKSLTDDREKTEKE